MTKSILIDVRSAAEFETGSLPGSINIEYVDIDQLPTSHAEISKRDNITLYCRSGRRSAIALDTLTSMGFEHVRDLGCYEDARDVLLREKSTESKATKNTAAKGAPASKESLASSTQKLLDGLRGLE